MIFTDVDAEWDPDNLAVKWVDSGGADPWSRNTIQYIAQKQYQKDYDSSTKKSTVEASTKLNASNLIDAFTRQQLNMYVEQYLEAVCRHDPNMWIPCAEENGSCFCPMGTVRYGHADTDKWATTSNTWSYMPEGKPCGGHGECPADLPHRGPWRQDGSYMCYRDQDYENLNGCSGGYTFDPEAGQCTHHWMAGTCGESCWKRKCDDAQGYWNPYVYREADYKDHLYTCYMPNLACQKSNGSTHPDVTECNCDAYASDITVSVFAAKKNPHNKAIVSDTAFAVQLFQAAQVGGAHSLKGIGSEALVECTNNQFGHDPVPHQVKTCECKRTTCKDLATIQAEFRKDYEDAWLHWNSF